ncbi:DUF2493 domain-containing protein [Falsiroseomonas sp. CW058]|uniref:DUF2493 domain-containing protein n=1 Tax=Falsiroseomonas sp. CW058 TaxID=3388664 RepID=UPI003D31EE22
MIRHGSAPFLECSTRGDRRFSALCARIRARGNRTIEEIYQSSKVFEDGSTGLEWRAAKGRPPINLVEVRGLYGELWDEYIAENRDLLHVLRSASGLSDMFGRPGSACQATELWRIRCGSRAMRVLVCGSRDFDDSLGLYTALDRLHLRRGISCLIHGGARGADRIAEQWAASSGVRIERYDADWAGDGRAAGAKRNQRMLDEGRPDGVVAFPSDASNPSRGTADMIARAGRAGIKVWVPLRPSGDGLR